MPSEVEKLWGSESWLKNDEQYCMKLLFLKPDFQSSLHYHKVKTETFLVVAGKVKLELLPYFKTQPDQFDVIQVRFLQPYQSITLAPFTPHRFRSVGGDAVIVEASTFHSDEDVVRLEESRAIAN
jgi:D-lyxose ketol-isomerase